MNTYKGSCCVMTSFDPPRMKSFHKYGKKLHPGPHHSAEKAMMQTSDA